MTDLKLSAETNHITVFNGNERIRGVDDPAGTPVTGYYELADLIMTGWIALNATCAYVSAATHATGSGVGTQNTTYSGVIDLTGDWTAYISAGMKWSHVQSGTTRYYGIHKVELSGGNTRLTLFGGTDYQVANAAITAPKFSVANAPLGFPLDETKWEIKWLQTSDFSQASPVQNTWYNVGSLAAPVGNYVCKESGIIAVVSTAAQTAVRVSGTLSNANNTEWSTEYSAYQGISGASGSLVCIASFGKSFPLNLTATTSLYFNMRTVTAAASISSLVTAYANQPIVISLIPKWL